MTDETPPPVVVLAATIAYAAFLGFAVARCALRIHWRCT